MLQTGIQKITEKYFYISAEFLQTGMYKKC